MKKHTDNGKVIQSEETFSNIWVSILLPLASVATTYIVALIIDKAGTLNTIYALSLIVLFVAIITFIVVRMFITSYAKKQVEYFDQEAQHAKSSVMQSVGTGGFNGVFPEAELARIESEESFSEIWLVSFDLSTEINDGVYANVVQDNIKRGIKYKYFVPKTDANKARIQIIKNKCKNNPNLEFYYLNPSFFFLVSEIDFAIYEPQCIAVNKSSCLSHGKKSGYMGVNIEGLSERYAVAMNADMIDAIISRLYDCISDSNAA